MEYIKEDTDKMINDIRLKRDAEMLDLWQKEYKETHNDLSRIRGDFYALKDKFTAKTDECTDKEIEVLTLKQSVKDLRHQLKQEMNTSQHWFRKSSAIELEKQNEQRKSAELLQQQHEIDESETNKYKIKAWTLAEKVSQLELDNETLQSRNEKLNNLVKDLLSTPQKRPNTAHYYARDTQSSLAKKVKKRLSDARSENLNHLLQDIERNVRDNLNKTKAARMEKYLLDANY